MPREITATIISIGDELLIGQTINTNAGWIGMQLGLVGVRAKRVVTIGDERQEIMDALGEADTDIVLITGGLGPTKDDITKHTLCEFFGTTLEKHPEIEENILAFFTSIGREPLEVNRAQADLPASCTVIPNTRGTASGMWFDTAKQKAPTAKAKVYVSMPGVPGEMKRMMLDTVLPEIQRSFLPPHIVHRTILTTGMGESHLAQRIEGWEDSLSAERIKLAYLPSPGTVKLRLSAYAETDPEAAIHRINSKVEELHGLIPELIFGEGEQRMQQVVGDLLKANGQTLALAESCTGGYVSHLITSVPGSSAYYTGGVVSYANAVKMEELGIPSDMLELNGAVSQPVAEKMATGVRTALRTDWSISITGIAGPDGGTLEKPVGTVWMAVAGPDGVWSKCEHFIGSRGAVIQRSALASLDMLRKRLLHQA
ncbi:MAG TPA: CinA family nicotinamide mononucleotide deamidase-related protein [Flavobacteriales bacterium]|nr:CinA family nicotinamide mononucleotide deamidase-related protein [Flavobacteriales bacterium]HQW39761.1 CinA family nicotinamide mononucleotide deamidase-related protein [Flavobacteriales bacterium]